MGSQTTAGCSVDGFFDEIHKHCQHNNTPELSQDEINLSRRKAFWNLSYLFLGAGPGVPSHRSGSFEENNGINTMTDSLARGQKVKMDSGGRTGHSRESENQEIGRKKGKEETIDGVFLCLFEVESVWSQGILEELK